MNNKRFLTLDIFRGLTVFFMIIVNAIPSEEIAYRPLVHAEWFGFTPTDLVFPSFLFAIGNALCFGKSKWDTSSPSWVYKKIFKRSILIFIIGVLMYWFPFVGKMDGHWQLLPLKNIRIMGVLQRIGIAFCIGSIMIYRLNKKTLLWTSLLILIVYQIILFYCGMSGENPLTLEGNAVLRLDLFLFGSDHLYKGEGIPFDPEGFLSSIPAVVNILLGYLFGDYLLKNRSDSNKLLKMSLYGFLLIAVGYLWGYSLPIGKKLWTPSYVILSSGLDVLLVLSIFVFVEQNNKEKYTKWLLVFGKNALAIYVFSQLFQTVLNLFKLGNNEPFYSYIFKHGFIFLGGEFGCLLQAIIYTIICWLLGYYLDKRKIYIKL